MLAMALLLPGAVLCRSRGALRIRGWGQRCSSVCNSLSSLYTIRIPVTGTQFDVASIGCSCELRVWQRQHSLCLFTLRVCRLWGPASRVRLCVLPCPRCYRRHLVPTLWPRAAAAVIVPSYQCPFLLLQSRDHTLSIQLQLCSSSSTSTRSSNYY